MENKSLKQLQIDYLNQICTKFKVSATRLAENLNLSSTTFTRFINDKKGSQKSLSTETISKLYNYSKIQPPISVNKSPAGINRENFEEALKMALETVGDIPDEKVEDIIRITLSAYKVLQDHDNMDKELLMSFVKEIIEGMSAYGKR